MRGCSPPCLANLSTSPLPTTLLWALTFWMVILWGKAFSVFTIWVMRSLYGWLYWEDGFLMWLRKRYMLLRLSMDVNVDAGHCGVLYGDYECV